MAANTMGDAKSLWLSARRWSHRVVAAAAVCVLAFTGMVTPSQAEPITQQFLCTGGEQWFSVPAGVTSLQVVATGAPGGTLPEGANAGGRGAQVTADLVVAPGDFLWINVGCPGAEHFGGFNGGGTANTALYGGEGAGGGGASDIRTISRISTGTLESRLIVAAGGGGEGGTNEWGNSTNGGAGGNAGADGGNAGGTTNSRGRAGTATAGGAGGSANGTSQQGNPQPGAPGQAGTGGNGGAYGVNTPGRGGGGGGGGLFGGGGGGGGGLASGTDFGGGGGGGGSSLVPAGGTLALADAGAAASVTITYEATPATTTTTLPATTTTTLPATTTTLPSTTTTVVDGPSLSIDDLVATNGVRGRVTGTLTCEAGMLFRIRISLTQGGGIAEAGERGECGGGPQPFAVTFDTGGPALFEYGEAQACVDGAIAAAGSRTPDHTLSDCQPVAIQRP